METLQVKSKLDFVKRYKLGEFGNASPTWNSVKDFLEYYALEFPPDDQLFHLRNASPGGRTLYNVTYQQIIRTTLVGEYYVSAMAPTDKTLIQGEVRRSTQGLELRYTKVRRPMRDALNQEQDTVFGLRANTMLAFYMDAVSYDWLQFLLDNYVDHIVEFSVYSVNWGTIPNRNTVFWEVRPDRNFGWCKSKFTEVY